VYNSEIKHFIRYGPNQNSGSGMNEIIIVDAEGNIDESTPMQWSYDKITSAAAYRIDDKPITIDGGHFTTYYNNAPSEYTYLDRNIQITRSNVTVKNIVHTNTGFGPTGAPMSGFTSTELSHNVEFYNIEFNNPKAYSTIGSAGTDVGMGSYEIHANASNNVRWIKCSQSNFRNENGEVIGQGMMGTNYCKNLYFADSVVCSFDAHCGTYNATLLNSEFEHINFIGEGLIYLENVTIHVDPKSYMINLRDDYGSTWQGDLVMKDCHIEFTKNKTDISLINVTFFNHDFGYQTYLPENIYIDGLTMSKYDGVNLHLYKKLEDFDVDIGDPEIIYPAAITGEIGPILNPYEPTKLIDIKNAPGINWIFPNTPQFKDMQVIIDGKHKNWRA
jgi:hypothetical protein